MVGSLIAHELSNDYRVTVFDNTELNLEFLNEWKVAMLTDLEYCKNAKGTKPANGSCRCMMSKLFWRSIFLTLEKEDKDKEILAIEPFVGIGTELLTGMKCFLEITFEHGANIVIECPIDFSWAARFSIWLLTPLGSA